MRMSNIDILLARATSPSSLRSDGDYTIPRSFGVYRITKQGNVGRRFRFGNHPVRMNEIIRDFGDCEVKALFLDRDDARQLASELNK